MGYNRQECLENTINTMGTLLGVHPIVPWSSSICSVFFRLWKMESVTKHYFGMPTKKTMPLGKWESLGCKKNGRHHVNHWHPGFWGEWGAFWRNHTVDAKIPRQTTLETLRPATRTHQLMWKHNPKSEIATWWIFLVATWSKPRNRGKQGSSLLGGWAPS